jgi:hypothetical protein
MTCLLRGRTVALIGNRGNGQGAAQNSLYPQLRYCLNLEVLESAVEPPTNTAIDPKR